MLESELLKQPVHWVDSDAGLESLCEAWQDSTILALDTEFIRTSTYYPIAGLLQINDGKASYLIDPKKINDWYPLLELLDDEKRIIAMHACGEDLEVLQIELGSIPAQIFDTQVAEAFAGGPNSMGYAALVEAELGIHLQKGETRSDWLQRPLSKPQILYAALDVEYLYLLAEKLIATLQQKQKLEWVMEEGRRAYKQFKSQQVGAQAIDRIKSAWKLQPRQLAALTFLADWRENFAQQKDLPRNRVLKEQALLDIALMGPDHISQLRSIDGMSERMIRSHGEQIISLLQQSKNMADSELPEALPRPLDKNQRQQFQKLKACLATLAAELDIAPEQLFRKKENEAMLRLALAERWSDIEAFFSGWRQIKLQDAVLTCLKNL